MTVEWRTQRSAEEPPAKLIHDDPEWAMPQPGQLHGAPRRLRVYNKIPFASFMAVVTDRGRGVSLNSVAEHVHDALVRRYPGAVVIAHYPAERGYAEEHFLEVTVDANDRPEWHPRAVDQMTTWCGRDILDGPPNLPPDPAEDALSASRSGPHGAGLADATVIHGYPGDDRGRVVLETPDGKAIGGLPHYVFHSPDGFDWGNYTTGARELARCILAAALGADARCVACAGTARVTAAGVAADASGRDEGATSRCPRCNDGIFVGFEGRFLHDYVARWFADRAWQITAGQVRSWLADLRATPQL